MVVLFFQYLHTFNKFSLICWSLRQYWCVITAVVGVLVVVVVVVVVVAGLAVVVPAA